MRQNNESRAHSGSGLSASGSISAECALDCFEVSLTTDSFTSGRDCDPSNLRLRAIARRRPQSKSIPWGTSVQMTRSDAAAPGRAVTDLRDGLVPVQHTARTIVPKLSDCGSRLNRPAIVQRSNLYVPQPLCRWFKRSRDEFNARDAKQVRHSRRAATRVGKPDAGRHGNQVGSLGPRSRIEPSPGDSRVRVQSWRVTNVHVYSTRRFCGVCSCCCPSRVQAEGGKL
jgi:hypothetical protein